MNFKSVGALKDKALDFFLNVVINTSHFGIMDIYINLTRQSRHFDITFIASSVQGAVLSFNITLPVNIWIQRNI